MRRIDKSQGERIGVTQLLSPVKTSPHLRARLLYLARQPQAQTPEDPSHHRWIDAKAQKEISVLLGFIEGQHLGVVRLSLGVGPARETGRAQSGMQLNRQDGLITHPLE